MKDDQLQTDLLHLKLSYFREHHQTLAKEAAEKNWTPLDYLGRLVETAGDGTLVVNAEDGTAALSGIIDHTRQALT